MTTTDEYVDPRSLTPHPLSTSLFGLGSEEEQEELAASLEAEGVRRPLTVTDETCAAGANHVLGGCRRRAAAVRAGLPLVPVRRLYGLSAAEEEAAIIGENLADQLGRRLLESRRASLEHTFLEKRRLGQGHRSDLDTSADASGGRGGDTRDRVAQELGVPRNALADRATIFFSPVTPDRIKQAVDAGTLVRSEAARLVRAALRESDVAAALKEGRDAGLPFDRIALLPPVAAAKAQILGQLTGRLREGPKKAMGLVINEAQGVLVDGACEVNYLRRRTRIELKEGKVRIVNVGRGDEDPATFICDAPTTRSSWVVDVRAAVAKLPAELREGVSVGDVEILDPVRCPTCGGTRFYRVGGCVTCNRIVVPPGAFTILEQLEPELDALEAEIRPSREELFRQLAGSASQPPTRDEQAILQSARQEIESQILRARSQRWQDKRRELWAAAEARDARAKPGLGWSEDLRYPRTRIRIATPRATLDIVLWEHGPDCGRSPSSASGPAILIGDDVVTTLLNTRHWWYHRLSFYSAVRRGLERVLRNR